MHGDCGEVVNTADCGSVTRGFDPHQSPQLAIIGASPSGKALDSDSSIGGSNPSAPAICLFFSPNMLPLGRRQVGKARDFDSRMRWFESSRPSQYDPLAQLVEHLTFNQGVDGSSPSWVTILSTQYSGILPGYFCCDRQLDFCSHSAIIQQ